MLLSIRCELDALRFPRSSSRWQRRHCIPMNSSSDVLCHLLPLSLSSQVVVCDALTGHSVLSRLVNYLFSPSGSMNLPSRYQFSPSLLPVTSHKYVRMVFLFKSCPGLWLVCQAITNNRTDALTKREEKKVKAKRFTLLLRLHTQKPVSSPINCLSNQFTLAIKLKAKEKRENESVKRGEGTDMNRGELS